MDYVEITYESYNNLKSKIGVYKIVCKDGEVAYYLDGGLHRKDKPAITGPDGSKYYYIND